MEFSCSQCGCFFTQLFPDGRFNPPTSCKNTNCESRKFAPQRSKHGTTNWQRIRVQELPDSDNIELGSIPRTIDCELTSSLVDSSSVGHIVNLCGVLKAVKSDQIEQKSFKKRKRDSYQCTFELYLEVHSVRNENETNNNMGISEFSLLDLHMMRTVKSTPHLFSFVVNSLCPSIFGNEIIKAGLCLSLFGGCVARFDSEKSSPARGDIHVLVVGDPGLGKSQMMKAAVHAAPKGFFVSGNSTSNSGLTVTMVREGGDFVLEAGALVLADQGICCIDEFDKMNADYQSLLEVMEQQTISIAKAGMICSLSARCSIIAAANPIGGHYNSSKTVQENLKLSPALLSRFDLIFILLDCPDEHRDMLLSDHVIRMHSHGPGRNHANSQSGKRSSGTIWQTSPEDEEWDSEKDIRERLRFCHQELLPLPQLRTYIAYARKYCRPKITDDAKQVLQEYFLEMRANQTKFDTTPVTTRQLESLMRLSEARAKIELRETVTAEDARDVVEIMKLSMKDLLDDKISRFGQEPKRGLSMSKQIKLLLQGIKQLKQTTSREEFSHQELYDLCQTIRLEVDDFRGLLTIMNNQGFLLLRPGNRYKIQLESV